MKKIVIYLFIFTIIGCKEDKSTKEDTVQEQVSNNDFFRVVLDVIVKKDDAFHIFYNEDGSTDFIEENSIWTEFKGSETSQKIVFDLPKDVIPSQLRIDFGLQKDQGEIKINSLEMSYYGKTTTISGADFFKYFRPNEGNTEVNLEQQTLKALIKPDKEFSGPSVYPLEPLSKEIEKITQ